jgi:hypothetical protein
MKFIQENPQTHCARRITVLFIICWIGILTACDSSKNSDWASPPHFEAESWKKDKMGCTGLRQQIAEQFDAIRNNLKGLSQDEVRKVLGNPDFQNLQSRHQKMYIYFIEPGAQCFNIQAESTARTVAVRFNAMGYATEVTYQQGKP